MLRRLLYCLTLVLPAGIAQAAEFSPSQRGEIEKIVREYLLTNPQVLQEVFTALEQKQSAAQADGRREAVKENASLLYRSPRHAVLGNPQGRVTLVEFFDYNCGYCKRALADMQELLKNDPDLKIVLKEFPVLGPGSVEAAQVSVAALRQGQDKFRIFHERLLAERGQVDKAKALAVAKAAGLDIARIEKELASPEVTSVIEESYTLANALGLTGTPSYVLGDEVVVGAVGAAALKAKVEEVRAAGCTIC